jgi:membrane fusion protein (multidrug efflux system)
MEVSDEYERVGQVRAIEDVELRARITGFLEQRLFEEGSDVEKGKLLFVIEQAPYEARVARAKAELARAKAALGEAELELRRTRRLRQDKVSSEANLDAAVAAEAEASAEVLAAEAGLTEARLDLEYTTIHAPVAGRIGRAIYSVGDLVGPDSGTLATLATLDPIHVYWQVPEGVILDFRRRNLERARNDQPPEQVKAQLRFGDGTLYEHEGVWDFLDNRIDPTTGTQTARAVFPNADGLLLPGQYAVVLVQVGEPRMTLAIPQSAVQEDQAGRFVLAVDDGNRARLRRVDMGSRRGIYWAVRSGLVAGDRVIYQGIQKVRPDAVVDPEERLPEPPVGTAAARAAAPVEPDREGEREAAGGSPAGT